MRYWKLLGGNYLIEGEWKPFPTSYVDSIALPEGDVIHQAATYYEFTPDGTLAATYGPPGAFSLEDDLCIHNLYAVMKGQFCRYYWHEQWGYESETSIIQTHYTNLQECRLEDVPFDLTILDIKNETTPA